MTKMTKLGRLYVSKKFKILKKEGYPKMQALAISYSMARKKGYKARR